MSGIPRKLIFMGTHILPQLEGICKNIVYLKSFFAEVDFFIFIYAFYGQRSISAAWTNPCITNIYLSSSSLPGYSGNYRRD